MILAISTSITKACKKISTVTFIIDSSILLLKYILCIYYLVQFQKNQAKTQTLLDFSNEDNSITLAYKA